MISKKAARVVVPANPNDGFHEIMAVGGQSWGRGADAKEALRQLRMNDGRAPIRKYMVVPKGAWIDDMGMQINWKIEKAGEVHKDGSCPLCQM